jgi:hypothetical protein
MPDCNYCEESFSDEDAYLEHLAEAHDEDELSRIDQRRVGQHTGDGDSDLPIGPIVLVGLILFTAAVIAYVAFFVRGGGSGTAEGIQIAQTPSGVGTVHEHGTINVTIDGEETDFSQPRYQKPRDQPAFHFERGNGDIWHKHGRGVTLQFAMASLGFEVNETTVVFDGTAYRDSDPGTSVTVMVNGESVDPAQYVLQGAADASQADEGDHVRIVVETNESG